MTHAFRTPGLTGGSADWPPVSGQVLAALALLAGLCGIALCAGGCGGAFIPDSRLSTHGNVQAYEQQLEKRLLDRYNNLPDYAGKISRVDLVLTRPPDRSVDGQELRAEFSQLVYDKWGNRVSRLEKEYYIITFGHGRPRLVRTDPSIKFGLDTESGYSERFPADPERCAPAPQPEAAPAAPAVPMLPIPMRSTEPEAVPAVPPASDDLQPTRLTKRTPEEPQALPLNALPRLLQGMTPPAGFERQLPRAEVRNLPPAQPDFEPELD